MNIKDLIGWLTEIAVNYPDATVMLATQPSYPITETLRGVADPDDELDAAEDLSDEALAEMENGPQYVWLVSGGQPTSHDASPYAPSWVFEVTS